MARHHGRKLRCSFCGKSREQVAKLVAGPGVFICDQCVALCNQIIAEEPTPPPVASRSSDGWVRRVVRRLFGEWLHGFRPLTTPAA